MKKLFGIFVLSMIFVSMGAGMVSAASEPVEAINKVLTGAYEFVKPVLEFILGETSPPELFLAKIILMIMVFAILWKSLEKIPFFKETNWVLYIVSIGVSILSMSLFKNADVVESILLPYSALGITISAAIPFGLFFLIVKDYHKTARKIAWIFFIIVFTTIGIIRWTAIKYSYVYLITAGAALLFLLFDKTIQRTTEKVAADHLEELARSTARTEITAKRHLLETGYRAGRVSDRDYITQDTHIKKLEKDYGITKG